MRESLNDAFEEMKRVDHMIYVSLKYTRTVDVLLNIIQRMIDGYERTIDLMLKFAVFRKIAELPLPVSPIERGELARKLFPEENVQKNIELFFLLRKLVKSKPQRENEFRKHLTMRAVVNGKEEIVNIEIITAYYNFQKEFIEYVKTMVQKEVSLDETDST